jgi:hypothetical protein
MLDSIVSPRGTSYLTHDDAGHPLAIKSWTGTVAYYVLDGAGSPIALIKADGTVASTYDYDPNGVATDHDVTDNTLTALNPYRYAGGMYDRTTDYVKFGQRWTTRPPAASPSKTASRLSPTPAAPTGTSTPEATRSTMLTRRGAILVTSSAVWFPVPLRNSVPLLATASLASGHRSPPSRRSEAMASPSLARAVSRP